jgi:hypothetical protein
MVNQPERPAGIQGQKPRLFYPITLLIINGISIVSIILGTVGLVGLLLLGLYKGPEINQISGLVTLIFTNLGILILILPSTLSTVFMLMGKPQWENKVKLGRPFLMAAIILYPLALGIGWFLSLQNNAFNILASPLNLLVVILPLAVIFILSTHNLKQGSVHRSWGLLSFGLTVTPILIMGLEILMVVTISGIAAFVVMKASPDAVLILNRLIQRLSFNGMNTEGIVRILQSYIRYPFTIYLIISLMCGFIPLLEELLKPLGCWFLLNRRLTPQEGFVAGIISGLAFSVIESLNSMTMVMNGSWSFTAIMRIGTGLIHISTTGLMGWALASSISDGRYYRLVLSYLAAVVIHGSWNLMVVTAVLLPFVGGNSYPKSLEFIPYIGLMILTIGMGVLLFEGNRRLRKNEPSN